MTCARRLCKPVVLWAGVLLACGTGFQPVGNRFHTVAQDDASDKAGPTPPEAPGVRLAAIDGFDDDAAYLRSVASRVAELVELAGRADDPVARADLLLAAANLILAHQLEPACTNALLGVDDKPATARDHGGLAASLDRADEFLDRAEAVVQPVQDGDDPPGSGGEASKRRLGMVRAFARALRAYLLPDESAEAKRNARRAASRLSALLEEDDEKVTAAARLWQASLRGREADPTPALSLLDLALSDPPREALTYAFFARLLRCRLVAKQGGFAAALALLSQLEERCEEWFPGEGDRADAVRATTLIEIRILRDWHGRLSAPAQAEEREWCASRIRTLTEARFPGDGNTVLRLHQAVPIVAHPP